jgi:hypothetical protein
MKFMGQFLFVNLVIDISLKVDNYLDIDMIAILWPFYGFIAISFIFFLGGVMLLIGTACNSFAPYEEIIIERNENNSKVEKSTFNLSSTFWILINATSFLALSVVGFIILL